MLSHEELNELAPKTGTAGREPADRDPGQAMHPQFVHELRLVLFAELGQTVGSQGTVDQTVRGNSTQGSTNVVNDAPR